MNTKTLKLIDRLRDMGFSFEEAQSLRRIEMTLGRWGEAECNGDIQRDETTGKTYRHYGHNTAGPFYTVKTADREKGALKRLAAIMANHPALVAYHQTDPRGCSLYIVNRAELGNLPIDASYTRGLAVCA